MILGNGLIKHSSQRWWLAGGISPANAIAIYQPKGAASLAASYSNLANPGVYDAFPGVAPTWDASYGWQGDGATTYLQTGIISKADWSYAIRFSDQDVGTPGLSSLLGGLSPDGNNLVVLVGAPGTCWYCNGNSGFALTPAPALASGVLLVAGTSAYRNGSPESGSAGAWVGSADGGELYLLATNLSGAAFFCNARVQAVAVYNTALTPAQAAALTTAMMAL